MHRKLKEQRIKRINRLYTRFQDIKIELKKKYHTHFVASIKECSLKSDIDDIEGFLLLLNEATKLNDIILCWDYKRYLKYAKGEAIYFYTPKKKKERRKSLRKIRNRPLSYYEQIYEEELHFVPQNCYFLH